MDYGAVKPEITSARIVGPGSGSMLTAAVAWDRLSNELSSAAASYQWVVSGVTSGGWLGPTSILMSTAVAPYIAWLSTTAAKAGETAAQAKAAAAAYETALATVVPLPVVLANRALLMQLIATNVIGQNAPAIAATEAHYDEMWAQDAAAMYGYAHYSALAASVSPYDQAPNPINSAQHAAPAAASASSLLSNSQQNLAGVPQTLHGLASPSSAPAPAAGTAPATTPATTPTSTSSATSALSSLSSLSSLLYPVSMSMYPMSMFLGPLMNRALSAGAVGAGAAAANAVGNGVRGLIPVATALGSATHAAVPAVTAGMGQATLVNALSVPQGWGAATVPAAAATTAAAAFPGGGFGAIPAGGPGIPYGLSSMAGMAGRGADGAPIKFQLGRLTVIPRTPVLG